MNTDPPNRVESGSGGWGEQPAAEGSETEKGDLANIEGLGGWGDLQPAELKQPEGSQSENGWGGSQPASSSLRSNEDGQSQEG